MNFLEFSLLVWLGSLAAGFLGSLTGLGGGVVIVPLLALRFGVDIHYAIGATLVSVIATSSGAAAAYVGEGFSNIRIGMFLEIATTTPGAIAGALPGGAHPHLRVDRGIFGCVLLYSAWLSGAAPPRSTGCPVQPDPLASRLRLNGGYPSFGRSAARYNVKGAEAGLRPHVRRGRALRAAGIGSGAVKVIAMDRPWGSRIRFRPPPATS